MSFSSEVKSELARIEPSKKCCMLAEIAGFLRVSGSIRLTGGSFGIVAETGSAAVARHYKILIETYFRNKVSLSIGGSRRPGSQGKRGKNTYYISIDPPEKSMQILRETGMILIREGDDYFSDGIYTPIVRSKCCKRSYLRGMFLSCGTMSDPRKSYLLEFVLDKEQSAIGLKKLIGSFDDISASLTERDGKHVVYMKKGAYISDMLGIMGASSAMLELESIRVNKSTLAKLKHLMNCEYANLDRTLKTAEQQISWLVKIASDELGREPDAGELSDPYSDFWTAGLRHLPPQLKEVAYLRLYRPEASLTDIGELLTPQVGRAAISKRFAKLRALAEGDDNGKESDSHY